MELFDITQLHDRLVIHFQSAATEINAYTFAWTLLNISDAAKAANASVNPGFDIEIILEAIGPGSFRAQIRAVYRAAENLFSKRNVRDLVIAIIAFHICRAIWPDRPINIVNKDEVILDINGDRIVVPRRVVEGEEEARKNPQFRKAIERTFDAVSRDERVDGIGFVKDMDSPPPKVIIPRERMRLLALPREEEPDERTTVEQADLHIIKAILQSGRRKWEFSWRGFKISAPVLDEEFYGKFKAHEIMIAPGDQLRVRLAIRQRRDVATGVYSNVGYEVIEVLAHVPAAKQMPLRK